MVKMRAEGTVDFRTASASSWLRPTIYAVILHLVLILLMIALSHFFQSHRLTPSARASIQASVDVSTRDVAIARQALRSLKHHQATNTSAAQNTAKTPPPPSPQPQPQPQPLPSDRPQTAVTEQQMHAQERLTNPDRVDQVKVSDSALSDQKAPKEQEAKQRQDQIDLTNDVERQKDAEQKLRLAAQQRDQANRDAQAQAEAQAKAEAQAERERKLDAIRRQKAQLEREASLAQQRLHQLAAAQAASERDQEQAASDHPASADPNLLAQYQKAIQDAVTAQWQRPSSVPDGQLCPIHIQQSPGGHVISVAVDSSCAFNDAGRRSIEEAVTNAQPLPYKGFESVFSSDLMFNFKAGEP